MSHQSSKKMAFSLMALVILNFSHTCRTENDPNYEVEVAGGKRVGLEYVTKEELAYAKGALEGDTKLKRLPEVVKKFAKNPVKLLILVRHARQYIQDNYRVKTVLGRVVLDELTIAQERFLEKFKEGLKEHFGDSPQKDAYERMVNHIFVRFDLCADLSESDLVKTCLEDPNNRTPFKIKVRTPQPTTPAAPMEQQRPPEEEHLTHAQFFHTPRASRENVHGSN